MLAESVAGKKGFTGNNPNILNKKASSYSRNKHNTANNR